MRAAAVAQQAAVVAMIWLSCARASRPQQSDCLSYPDAPVRPTFASSLDNELDEHASLLLSPDGKIAVLSDTAGRLVAWGVAQGNSPTLHVAAGDLRAVTRYGGAYIVSERGQLRRQDLRTGEFTTNVGVRVLPSHVGSATLDPSGRYLAVARTEGPKKAEVVVLDDCLLQGRDIPDCDGKQWWWPVPTGAERIWSAFRQRDVVITLETPKPGKANEVVLRSMPTGQGLGAWTSESYDLIVSGELAVEWAEKSGKLTVRKVADGTVTGEVELGESYASDEVPTCYSVEPGSDGFVVVRRWSSCGLGKSGWMWAVVDLEKRKIVWRTTENLGAVAVGPERRLYMATERGVCMSRIGS